MERYIDKYALVAKIEEIKNNANKRGAIGRISTITLCNELLSFLDTTEVKDVDLDKEIDEHWDEWAGKDGFHFKDFAKHFLELGLKLNQKEE